VITGRTSPAETSQQLGRASALSHQLAARAFVYGLARMAIDGHFPEWHPSEPPSLAVRRALHLFMSQMTIPSKTQS
jgi:hypothetical protein